MEGLRAVPWYRSFGFRVFLFNIVLLFAVIAPTRIITRMDYKHLMDRSAAQTDLFNYCARDLVVREAKEWPDAIEAFPRILPEQRICVFTVEKELVYDSGVMREFYPEDFPGPVLPSPYIDPRVGDGPLDRDAYLRYLRDIDISKMDPRRFFQVNRTLRYAEGADRVVLMGKLVRSADGKDLIFTLGQSVVDILIQGRSVKERFLFLYAVVALLSLLLTGLLSGSTVLPLKKLYAYSRAVLASKRNDIPAPKLPKGSEIGEICRALQGRIAEQAEQAERFMRFSSDVVHELRTPLSAIRSGLEVYAESANEREKEKIYERINARIRRMDDLMDEIRLIGVIESNAAVESCPDISPIIEELRYEYKNSAIRFRMEDGVAGRALALSPDKAYRALSNLLKNAVCFSPAPGSVELSIRIEGGFLAAAVRDRGPGIAEEVFPHITRRFCSFHPQGEGTHSGLGLSIVEAILRSCGGSLEYGNRSEGGAEFLCRVPLLG